MKNLSTVERALRRGLCSFHSTVTVEIPKIAEGGQYLWSVASAQAGAIFPKADIAHIIGTVFDAPMGRGSFHYVARTIERLLASASPPQISITVSSRNLEGLPDLIRYFLERDMPFTINGNASSIEKISVAR